MAWDGGEVKMVVKDLLYLAIGVEAIGLESHGVMIVMLVHKWGPSMELC